MSSIDSAEPTVTFLPCRPVNAGASGASCTLTPSVNELEKPSSEQKSLTVQDEVLLVGESDDESAAVGLHNTTVKSGAEKSKAVTSWMKLLKYPTASKPQAPVSSAQNPQGVCHSGFERRAADRPVSGVGSRGGVHRKIFNVRVVVQPQYSIGLWQRCQQRPH